MFGVIHRQPITCYQNDCISTTTIICLQKCSRLVLFGHDSNFKSDDTFDLIIVLAKLFILYKCKIQKNIPQFDLFKRYLKRAFKAEKHIAIVNMAHKKFVNDWYFYKNVMETNIIHDSVTFDSANCTCTHTRTHIHTHAHTDGHTGI